MILVRPLGLTRIPVGECSSIDWNLSSLVVMKTPRLQHTSSELETDDSPYSL